MRLPPWTWKILRSRRARIAAACSPFALLIAIVAFYAGVNAWSLHAQKRQAAGLAARGFQADVDAYLREGADHAADVFQHPAMLEELAKGWILRKSVEEGGLASKRFITTPALGRSADLVKLLSPPPATEKEAADRLLALEPDTEVHWRNLRPAFSRSDAAWPGSSLGETNGFLLRLRSFGEYARVHALAEMVEGNHAEVLADLQAMIDLERHSLTSRPLMVSFLVGSTVQSNVSELIWEGVHRRFWDESDLARISEALAVLDPLRSPVLVLRGEIAVLASSANRQLEGASSIARLKDFEWSSLQTLDWKEAAPRWHAVWLCVRPSGFERLGEIRRLDDYLSVVRAKADQPIPRFTITDVLALRAGAEAEIPAVFAWKKTSATFWVSTYAAYSGSSYYLDSLVENAFQIQAQLEILRTGVALERHHLKSGSYPVTLSDLVPAYLPAVPTDPFADKPLHYRLQADGSPVVWSVGKNLLDDGGIPNRSNLKGDVVWLTQPLPGFTDRDYNR